MGILEQKRRLKNNVIGDTIRDINERAKEEKGKSNAIIDLNKVRKSIKNSEFDIKYNDLKNDLKYQNLQDEYTNKQCNMMIRQSRNESKLNIIKKDTSNKLVNKINVIFSILSGCLSMAGVILSYYDKNNTLPNNAKIPCIIFSILMFAVTLGNSCFVQNKLFDTFRLKKDKQVYITILGYSIVCISCFVISIVTNKISVNKLLENCNLRDIEKVILSFTFTILFDLVPLLNNAIKFYFNMCLYDKKTNDLFTDNTDTTKESQTQEKNKNSKTFQNTTNTTTNEPKKIKIGFNSDTQKVGKKAGRKIDKRTINNIKNKVDMLESGQRITNNSINYAGSRKTLKNVCKNYLDNIEYRTDKKGNELMFKL